MRVQQLCSKGVETKPSFAVFFILGMQIVFTEQALAKNTGRVVMSTLTLSQALTCVPDKSAGAQGCPTVKSESASGLSGGLFKPFMHSFH